MKHEIGHLLRNVSQVCGAMALVLLLSTPLTWALTDAGTGFSALVVAKLILGALLGGFFALLNLGPMIRQKLFRPLVAATPGSSTPSASGTEGLSSSPTASASLLLAFLRVAAGVLVVVIVLVLNLIATLTPREIDLTREGIHTLAEQTRSLLTRLPVEVEIYAFYDRDEPVFPLVRERLRRYANASDRLRVHLVEPNQRPDLVERFEPKRTGHRVVAVTSGAQGREARAADASEQALTNLLIEVAERPHVKILFLSGHGETGLHDDGPEGYRTAAALVRGEGYEVDSLRLLDTGVPPAVPNDAGAVVIAGARGTLMEAELLALEQYLERGGRVLVLLEPHTATGIDTLLRQWKIEVHDDIIADSVSQMLGLGWSGPVIQAASPSHPITRRVKGAVMMHTVRSLSLRAGGEARVEAQALVQTGHSAWGEAILENGQPRRDPNDRAGPLLVGVVSTRDLGDGHSGHGHAYAPENQGRLVVFGDSDWLNNRLAPQQANGDLFLNTLAWLTSHEEKIAIRPRVRARGDLALAPKDLGRLKFFTMDILPVFVIGFGVGVVQLRRRR